MRSTLSLFFEWKYLIYFNELCNIISKFGEVLKHLSIVMNDMLALN
jgi:hypothetical protein